MFNYFKGTTTNNFKKFSGSGTAHFIIINDSPSNTLQLSTDGQSDGGQILPESGIEFLDVNLEEIWVKSYTTGNSCPFRLWFTGKKKETSELIQEGVPQTPKFFIKGSS